MLCGAEACMQALVSLAVSLISPLFDTLLVLPLFPDSRRLATPHRTTIAALEGSHVSYQRRSSGAQDLNHRLLQHTLRICSRYDFRGNGGVLSDSTPLYANDKISHTDVTFCFTPSATIAKDHSLHRHCLSTPMTPLLHTRRLGMSRLCSMWQRS